MQHEIEELKNENKKLHSTLESFTINSHARVIDELVPSSHRHVEQEVSIDSSEVNLTQTVSQSMSNEETSQKKTILPKINDTENEKNVDKELFVCSIEADLTLEDIVFILQDANISTEGITLEQPNKNFKNKKYIVVKSLSKVKLFNFKMSLLNSSLKETWFIRTSPPKFDKQNRHTYKHNYVQNSTKGPTQNRSQTDGSSHHLKSKANSEKPFPRYNTQMSTKNYSNSSRTYASVVNQSNKANDQYIKQEDFQHFLETVIQNMLIR